MMLRNNKMIVLIAWAMIGLLILDSPKNVNGFTVIGTGKMCSSASSFVTTMYSSNNNGMFDPEEASKRGANKINSISIEERTRRAMLAEATEDRMVSLMDELEKVLKTNDNDDGKEETVESLTLQIKSLQNDYNTIVSGEPFALLGDFGNNSSSSKGSGNDEA